MAERGIFHGGIEIHRKARTGDGKGGWTETFALSSSPRGRISPLSLGDQTRAAQSVGPVTDRFSTAGSTDVKKGDRVVYGSRTLEVQAVSTTSTGQRKQCLCEELSNAN